MSTYPHDRVAAVLLSWLPLGAGDNTGCVKVNGRIYEAVVARFQRRDPRPLFHAALEVWLSGHRFVIEMTPAWDSREPDRGVVGEGPVGQRWLGRSRAFRYEVRRWRDGVIPDAALAVDSPRAVDTDPHRAALLLALVPEFPKATWGRDELRTGEMWNSNSLVAWLLAESGHDTGPITPPSGGRAPGWAAGLTVASRMLRRT